MIYNKDTQSVESAQIKINYSILDLAINQEGALIILTTDYKVYVATRQNGVYYPNEARGVRAYSVDAIDVFSFVYVSMETNQVRRFSNKDGDNLVNAEKFQDIRYLPGNLAGRGVDKSVRKAQADLEL